MDTTYAKAIGYFREENPARKDCPSLTEQNRAFLDFCKRQKLDVAATFLDTNSGQTGFRQMLDYLRRDPENATLVISSLQRLGHDVRQTARAYFQLKSLGIQMVSLDGSADSLESLLTSWNARAPSERTGARVRDAMRRKALKGEVLGRLPFGYRVGPRRRLQPHPEEAEIVRAIFQLYTQQGLGIRLVARWLNEHGYSTRRGGKWSMVTIRDILRNRVYLGTYTRFGVRVPGSHPAIISPEEFRRAQDRMSRRRTGGARRTRTPFLLSGLLQCGYCGNHLIGVSRRQGWHRRGDDRAVEAEYRYYQCETRTNQSMCDYHTRRAAALEEEVRARLEAELRQYVLAPLPAEGPEPAAELDRLRARQRRLDLRLEQLLDAGAAGHLSPGRLQADSIEIAQQQLALDQQIAELEQRVRECRDHAQRLNEYLALLVDLAPERWNALMHAEQQSLLIRLLQRVIVRDEAIEIVLRAL
jgi:site-specific DNA recombinase